MLDRERVVGRARMVAGAGEAPFGAYLASRFPRFAADLEWWANAAKAQRAVEKPPY